MTIQAKRFILRHLALVASATLGFAGAAQAAQTWNLTSSSLSGVSVSGVTINGTTVTSGSVADYGGGLDGGLGVVNSSENPNKTGPHSTDGYGGLDALVLSFTQQVSLNGFAIGWNGTDNPSVDCLTKNRWGSCTSSVNYNDSDMAVYAWTGDATGPTNSTAGWQLIGNYYNVGASNGIGNTTDKQGGSQAISTTTSSSYWMISALGTGSNSCGMVNDSCVDAFKLLSVAGNVVQTPPSSNVPEPGSLALLGLGAAGLLAARRQSVARR